MPHFGKYSEAELATCHPDIQKVMREVVKYVDFTVKCGHRGKEAQDEAVKRGFSKTPWPTSKHNAMPSNAVDVIPHPTGYTDENNQILLAGMILGIAAMMGVDLRWGGDWNENDRIDDDRARKALQDYPHFELRV